MKFAPFKPCTLPKHVRMEILHREFPVKNLYFPCKGLQCVQIQIWVYVLAIFPGALRNVYIHFVKVRK